MQVPTTGLCPLCARPVTLTDWRPVAPWLVVEGCGCGGFFVEVSLIERLAGVSERIRQNLALRVLGYRAIHQDAWVTTRDGTVGGPLTVSPERPW
jgi:hypothetical protein